MMRRRLLSGPHVLLGFATLCDGAWGRPCPPAALPTVAPTCVGGVPLPFPCPHCGAADPDWDENEFFDDEETLRAEKK
jgi:hypothetical protein